MYDDRVKCPFCKSRLKIDIGRGGIWQASCEQSESVHVFLIYGSTKAELLAHFGVKTRRPGRPAGVKRSTTRLYNGRIYLCRQGHKHRTHDGANNCGYCRRNERKQREKYQNESEVNSEIT